MRLFLVTIFFLLGSSSAWAAELIRLYEWLPGRSQAPLILPVKASENPEVAARRYLQNLTNQPDIVELFEGKAPELSIQNFKPLNESTRESRALLIANLPKDYTQDSLRVTNFKKIFADGGHTSYILPLVADIGLSQSESRDFHKQIAEKFPFMVAMGGDDVAPHFYGQENFHSGRTIPARDQFEIRLIKSYVAYGKGFLLGVCRGSQISSVALGYKMIQDIPFHIGEKVAHSDHWHNIEIKDTQHQLLRSLVGAEKSLHVNSLHHQSVIFKEDGPLQLAAQSPDGITEATEFKNGRGLLLQFHPELMNNPLGSKIIWKVLEQKNKVMPRSCSRLFL